MARAHAGFFFVLALVLMNGCQLQQAPCCNARKGHKHGLFLNGGQGHRRAGVLIAILSHARFQVRPLRDFCHSLQAGGASQTVAAAVKQAVAAAGFGAGD